MRTVIALVGLATLLACSKPVTPGSLSEFQMPAGSSKFAACTAEMEGKRFSLPGVVVVDGAVRVSDGQVTMSMAERPDGGATTRVVMEEGVHVSFDVAGAKTKSAGDRRTETTGRLDGVTLHTTTGDVAPGEPVTAIVELSVQPEISGCSLEVIELRRR